MKANIAEISDKSFDREVLKSYIPVLVDFWAPWCGPCRSLVPIFEAVAKDSEFEGKVKFCKINVEDNEETSVKYNVRSIPALLLFKNGKLATTSLGVISENKLKEFLQTNV